jgi:hypothetical protein
MSSTRSPGSTAQSIERRKRTHAPSTLSPETQSQVDRPGTRCNSCHERLENISKEARAEPRPPHVLHLSRGRPMECRAAGRRVRRHHRRIRRRGPGAAARVPAAAPPAAHSRAVRKELPWVGKKIKINCPTGVRNKSARQPKHPLDQRRHAAEIAAFAAAGRLTPGGDTMLPPGGHPKAAPARKKAVHDRATTLHCGRRGFESCRGRHSFNDLEDRGRKSIGNCPHRVRK